MNGVGTILVRGAELLDGARVDLRVAGDRIDAIAPTLRPGASDDVIEARGGLLLPGLIDHHLHLFATAAAKLSVDCGPPAVHDAEALRGCLQAATAGESSAWLRGVGFHDSVHAGLDRDWLDHVVPNRPVRIQHRSGMLWVLNSAALSALQIADDGLLPVGAERDAEGRLTGRFYDLDDWLGARLPRTAPSLQALSAELASYGITAVTDTGARNNRASWAALAATQESGELRQRLLLMGDESLNELATRGSAWRAIGPVKLYLRETALPPLEALAERMRAAHAAGRAVAVHCVSRVELLFAMAALGDAGVHAGDRIEHAAIADDDAVQQLAALGVTVVTQPHFIAERGDQYRRDVADEDLPWLYRGAGFLRGGVKLAAGSDAPYGSLDPWAAMRAAGLRRTATGMEMGRSERLAPAAALALYGGSPARPGGGVRQLAVGQLADLCLLDDAAAVRAGELTAERVRLTVGGGQLLFRRE